jgi:hypothetical protein
MSLWAVRLHLGLVSAQIYVKIHNSPESPDLVRYQRPATYLVDSLAAGSVHVPVPLEQSSLYPFSKEYILHQRQECEAGDSAPQRRPEGEKHQSSRGLMFFSRRPFPRKQNLIIYLSTILKNPTWHVERPFDSKSLPRRSLFFFKTSNFNLQNLQTIARPTKLCCCCERISGWLRKKRILQCQFRRDSS